jgi:NTP pyrophosphatase (non-canonical NTP hydrolase)
MDLFNDKVMGDIEEIKKALIEFRDARDWNQFHNPKDLAIAISIEAGELLEQFLWKDPETANETNVRHELADLFAYCILMAEKYNFNIKDIVLEKIEINKSKYPIEKAKGISTKYTDL